MPEKQQLELLKSKRDLAMDVGTLAIFCVVVYFVLNPDAYDRVTMAVNSRLNAISHRLSVWQTRLSIRSLPETDDPS